MGMSRSVLLGLGGVLKLGGTARPDGPSQWSHWHAAAAGTKSSPVDLRNMNGYSCIYMDMIGYHGYAKKIG